MIEPGDLHKPAKLYVVDGYKRRTWRTLWRKRERKRLVFAGFISQVNYGIVGGDGPSYLSVELEDATSRLQRIQVSQKPEKGKEGT